MPAAKSAQAKRIAVRICEPFIKCRFSDEYIQEHAHFTAVREP